MYSLTDITKHCIFGNVVHYLETGSTVERRTVFQRTVIPALNMPVKLYIYFFSSKIQKYIQNGLDHLG